MNNIDILKGMTDIDKERMLKSDKRTSSEYLRAWISDLNNDDEELLAVYHLLEAIKALDINIPKEVIIKPRESSQCPNCEKHFEEDCNDGYYTRAYTMERCPYCQQKLKWR